MNREAKRVISREVCIARICLRAFFPVFFPLDSRATPSSTTRILNMVARDLLCESQKVRQKSLVALLQPLVPGLFFIPFRSPFYYILIVPTE